MKTILENVIPPFVRDSPFLVSLLENGPFPESGIEVPEGCVKNDFSIGDAQDLTALLKTVRFWMVTNLLEDRSEFHSFAFNPQNRTALLSCATEFKSTIPYVSAVAHVAHTLRSDRDKVQYAASHGHVHLLRFMCEELNICAIGGMCAASKADHIACLEFLHLRGERLTYGLACGAAQSGSLKCLQYMRSHGVGHKSEILFSAAKGGSLPCMRYLAKTEHADLTENYDKVLLFAAREGRLAVVQYLWEEHSALHTVHSQRHIAFGAVEFDHVPILKFAHAQSFKYFKEPTSASGLIDTAVWYGHLSSLEYLYSIGQFAKANALLNAVICGQVACIRFLLQNNCPIGDSTHAGQFTIQKRTDFDEIKILFEMGLPWNEETTAAAAGTGKLENLIFLRERGCPWDERTCDSAARTGHLNCLQYAHENGCSWKDEVGPSFFNLPTIATIAARSGSLDCVKYVVGQGATMSQKTALEAIRFGSVRNLQYLLSQGCPVDASVCSAAVLSKEPLALLRLLHEYKGPWDERTCSAAAHAGNLECLQFAHENGCPWDEATCRHAGNLACLQYAHQNGCPWDVNTCTTGFYIYSNLECLRYAWENGCLWDANTCASAAGNYNITTALDCVSFMHENGCAWDARTCAKASSNLPLLTYAHEHGCPWDEETCVHTMSRECYEYAVEHGCPGKELNELQDSAFEFGDLPTEEYDNYEFYEEDE